jgi:hypothetical protein
MDFDDQNNLELTALCNALVDETITADQRRRLQQWLGESEEVRRFYVRFMSQDASLCSYAAEMQTDPADAPLIARPSMEKSEFGQRLWSRIIKPPIARMRASLWQRFAPCALAVVLLMVFLLSQTINNNSQSIPRPDSVVQPPLESMDDGVAVLTQAVAIEWDQEAQPKIGDTIPPSVLRLKSGLAQIEFYYGASLLLEGPAELQLISASKCFCREGKFRVVVPQAAQGFTVLSADIEMVDLGTEFGVEVTPQRETQVHVFDGKVELYPPDTQRAAENRIELLAGTGRRIEHSGESSPIVADPKAFVSMRELKRRVDEDMVQRADLWKQNVLAMKQDPRFVAIYSFTQEGEQDRVLHNHSRRGRSLDGAVVGCEWSEGRWPGKRALEFKRPGDRVCIQVPGEYDALTLTGWIRVDGLDREYSSLMLTDRWDVGEIHWQILKSGQLRLGICHLELVGTSKGLGFNYDSPVVWDLSRIGQWIHVAVVVDNPSGFVTHFANGRELSREPLHTTVKLRVGDAQIGNWRPYPDSFSKLDEGAVPIRNFNGRIDEFMIAGQALTNEDIQSLYQKGKPALQK